MEDKEFYIWLTGFLESKGCFHIALCDGKWFYPTFSLSMDVSEMDTIFMIYLRLRMGQIYKHKKRNSIVFKITRKADIQQLIPILDTFPFQTSKKKIYILWKRAVEIMSTYIYRTDAKLTEELNHLRTTINQNYKEEDVQKFKELFINKNPFKQKIKVPPVNKPFDFDI